MNQNPTTYTYADPLWRMTSVTNQNYPAVNFSYADPNHSETYMNFNGSVSTVDTTTTVDGLGRPILVQKRQGQGSTSFDSVQYQYYWANTGNVAGAFTEQSLPYSGSGSPVSTTTQYDAVGRPAITTDPGGGKVNYTYSGNDVLQTIELPPGSVRKQFEYDGLGRLTSVCELTVGTTAWPGGSCKQTFGQTGYWTTYTYDALGHLKSVTQNAQGSPTQTRSYYYDGLGRLTQESNPESGTTWYFWDAAPSACGSGGWSTPGDLGAKKDNAGVYNCYGYDTLHRLVGFGPLSIIPNKNCTSLVYDAPQSGWPPPSGSNLQNTKGRLIEAYTNTNCDGHTSIVTDEWYGYSPRGEVTDIYTSTPNSNGYYHVGKSYWANGALRTLTGIPGVPTITYGADGEGRPTTVTAGSQNLVTTTSYNAASQVTGVTLGSGDSDSYTYDSATDRMTQYSFHVGGSSLVGKLTWNINGTLGALSIADPFNSTNQQNCTYAYDDLARLGGKDANGYSVDCGATWAQTFTLDPFGNILKTGNSSWNPNYASPPNNQYMLGWSGISYDADGHLTNDTFHTYQWDANGHAIGIGPISPLTTGSPSPQSNQTFDALGNLVEQNIPSDNWTAQYLHDEHGAELGFAHAQAAGWTWIRLPGGATAIYVGGSLQNYWHADWMGSARFGSTPSQGMFSDRAFAPYGEPYASAGSSYQSFAGLLQNLSADLFDTPNREYHPTQGRWISPDPAGLAAVDPSNPQTWNRYAYVRNNPVRSIDPSGLCDVVIGGITQSSMDPGAAGLTSFANSIGADLVFPYQNGSTFGGVLDVAGQGLGLPNAASLAVVAAINQAAGDPGPINVFTFSGGAQAFNSALGYLPVDVQARINNVTYVSPGALSDLAPGNGNTTVISNSSGGYDPYIFAGSYGDASLMNTDCAHRSNCTFPQQTPFLVSQAGSGCSATTTFSRSHGLLTINPAWFGAGGFGGFGAGWNEFDLLSLYFGTVESVTHRIY
jgi:RHS repeat-associated protein